MQDVISELDELVKRNPRLSGQQVDIDELALSMCEKHNIFLTELRSGSRRHEIVEMRKIVSWIAVRELAYSGADVDRYLGVSTSRVNRSVSSGKSSKLEEYIK